MSIVTLIEQNQDFYNLVEEWCEDYGVKVGNYDLFTHKTINEIFKKDEKYGYLRLSTTNDQEHFRLSYTVYGCEGGASGYFPLSEEDIYEGSKGKFVSVFNGGFIGDDVEELAAQLYNWCRENGYQ